MLATASCGGAGVGSGDSKDFGLDAVDVVSGTVFSFRLPVTIPINRVRTASGNVLDLAHMSRIFFDFSC